MTESLTADVEALFDVPLNPPASTEGGLENRPEKPATDGAAPRAPMWIGDGDPLPIPRVPSQTGGTSDSSRGLTLLGMLCPDTNWSRLLVIPGEPYSKSRPRFARSGRAYTKPADREREEYVRAYLRRTFDKPQTGNVALGCVFFRSNRQRIDADNLLKHICDAANGILFLDDSQVTAITAFVELDLANPRTLLVVGQHISTMTRGTDNTAPCERCGAPIKLGGPKHKKRFCGNDCSRASRATDLSEPIPCRNCGNPFRRKTTSQQTCSSECSTEMLRGVARETEARPLSCCATCGKKLTHRRGGRCRDCWRANPAGYVSPEGQS